MSTLGFLKYMCNQKRILVKSTNVRTAKRTKSSKCSALTDKT